MMGNFDPTDFFFFDDESNSILHASYVLRGQSTKAVLVPVLAEPVKHPSKIAALAKSLHRAWIVVKENMVRVELSDEELFALIE